MDLSYHDLLEREESFTLAAQAVLAATGAEFVHFEATGDALRFQCVFSEGNERLFHEICDGLSPSMDNGLAGRLLFVDKDLGSLLYYSLCRGTWQEGTLALPLAGYLDEPVPVKVGAPPPYSGPERRK